MVPQVGFDGFKEIRLQCLVGMEEGMDLEEAVEEYAHDQNTFTFEILEELIKYFFKRRCYPKDLFKIKVQLLECKTKMHSKAPLFKQTQIKQMRQFFIELFI